MRRHIIMGSLGAKEYIQDMYASSTYGDMTNILFWLRVRQHNLRNKTIGVWRVKELKPKAFTHHSIIPGTFKTWEQNKNTNG